MTKYGVSIWDSSKEELLRNEESLIKKVIKSFIKEIGKEFEVGIRESVAINGYEEIVHVRDCLVEWQFIVEVESGRVV